MLRELKLSYTEYVILIATAYVAKVISVTFWGRVAVRFGIMRLLWIGGIGIVPVAGAWILSDSFWFLIVVQLAAGTAWAAYELAVFLICFNSIRAEERTSILTLFNLSTTAAMVVGSLGGAAVLLAFGATRPVYGILFVGSSLLRIGTLFFLRRVPARLVEPLNGRRGRLRMPSPNLMALRPLWANLPQTPASSEPWVDSNGQPLRRPA
jgi:MFS family permease